MGNLGFQELLVIFIIALFAVGPKRLPDLARAFGEAMRAFQDALRGRDEPPGPPKPPGDRHAG